MEEEELRPLREDTPQSVLDEKFKKKPNIEELQAEK
jgi:hypothetical protein